MNTNLLPADINESMGITAQREIELLVLLDNATSLTALFTPSTDDLLSIFTKATDLLSTNEVYYRPTTTKMIDGFVVLSVILPELERAGYTIELRSRDFRKYPCTVAATITSPQPIGCQLEWEFEISPQE